VLGLAFSPDGRSVAGGGRDLGVHVWDAETGILRFTCTGHTAPVVSVAFSPDGRLLASSSSDATVRLWDAHTGAERRVLTGHTKIVAGVRFSPDSRCLASASFDRTIQVWDTTTGDRRLTLKGHTDSAHDVAFSPDGRFLASAGADHSVRLWDARTGDLVHLLTGHANLVIAVSFSPDGRRLASGSMDGTVKVWDTLAGTERLSLSAEAGQVLGVAFSSDGRQLAATCQNGVRVWDAHAGPEERTLRGHTDIVENVAFSPDGSRLASASYDNTVRIWDVRTGKVLLVFRGHTDLALGVAFSADGKLVASGSRDRTARIWDAQTGEVKQVLEGHEKAVHAVAFSPDGQLLVTGSEDLTVRVWNARTGGKPTRTFTKYPAPVTHVAFSTDGKRVLSDMRTGRTYIWDATVPRFLNDARDGMAVAHTAMSGQWLARPEVRDIRLIDQGPLDVFEQGYRLRATELDIAWHAAEADRHHAARQWEAAVFHVSRSLETRGAPLTLHLRRVLILATGVERDPKDGAALAAHALILLSSNDRDGYRRACAALLSLAEAEPSLACTRRATWACLLAPKAVDDLRPLLRWAERGVVEETESAELTMLGGLLLRAGEYELAAKHLEDAIRRRRMDAPAHAELLLAIACHHRKHSAEAQFWLARGSAWSRRFERAVDFRLVAFGGPMALVGAIKGNLNIPDPTGMQYGWQTVLELKLLQNEAEALISTTP
jgi:uncharacterized protein with WD repeat